MEDPCNIETDDDCVQESLAAIFIRQAERQRSQRARTLELKAAEAAVEAAKQKVREMCVYFCYQDVGQDVYKYNNGFMLHGWYRIVKTESCYEFTLMDTDMEHDSWQKVLREKRPMRFPLEMMGKGTFKDIPLTKIYVK
jgi:hypothetical protein